LTDVWHNSVTHVEAPTLGDKDGMVAALAHRLRADFGLS